MRDEQGKVVDICKGDPDAGLWTKEAVKSSNSDKMTVDLTTITVTTRAGQISHYHVGGMQ